MDPDRARAKRARSFPLEKTMETLKDKTDVIAVIEEVQARLGTLRRLAAAVPEPPNPRPQESDAELKRTVARLRSGEIRPADPAIDADTLAAAMEREVEYRERLRELKREADHLYRMLRADMEARAARLLEQALIMFHEARHLPEAADPDSDVSESIRRMERARRAEFGRKRRK